MNPGGSIDQPLARAGISGLQPASASKLARKGVRTVRDLLEYVPRTYLDLATTKSIRDLKIGEQATVLGTVKKVDGRYLRGRKHMLTVKVGDGTGFVEVVFWNQPFRTKAYPEGATVAVAGRFERRAGKLQVSGQPIVEVMRGEEGVHTGRIIPIHPATEGVSATMIRRAVHSALERYADAIDDPLPVPAICTLVAQHGDVPTTEMWDVFNMGCGFVALVPDDRAADAVALLGAHHPGTARIGTVTGDGGRLSAPGL